MMKAVLCGNAHGKKLGNISEFMPWPLNLRVSLDSSRNILQPAELAKALALLLYHTNTQIKNLVKNLFVSWRFEPSQPLGIV